MKKPLLILTLAFLACEAFAQQDPNAPPPQQGNPNNMQQQGNPNNMQQQQGNPNGYQQVPPPPPPPQQRPVSTSPRTRINLYGTYVFDDGFDSYYSDYDYYHGTLEGGFMGGVGLEFLLKPHKAIELYWMHQNTNAPTYYRNDTGFGFGESYDDLKVGLDYIMLGFNRIVENSSGKVEGYGGLSLGMAIVGIDAPQRQASGSASKFAWGLKLGANIWASNRIGIKLQAHLQSIVSGAGGGLYFGTGGVGAGISTYSTFYQFGLGGGLTFKIGS